jgi:MYXO-CTERM domain-containing protein
MKFKLDALLAPLLVSLALALVLAHSQARAAEATAQATLTGITFEVYDAIPTDTIAPSVTFWNDVDRWRTLVQPYGGLNGELVISTVVYRPVFDASGEAEQIVNVGGSAGGSAQGVNLWAASGASAYGYSFTGYAGVSSTATGQVLQGFYNMILGVGTGVRLTGHAAADVSLVDRCLVTCGEAYAQASVYARFGGIDPAQPGIPQAPVTRTDTLWLQLDATVITGGGGVLALQDQRDLSMSYENLSGSDQIGRVRWDAWTTATAPVPEPASALLAVLGLAALALRGRRR